MVCPFCAEEIKDQAIVCRYCGKDIPSTKSPTEIEGAENHSEQSEVLFNKLSHKSNPLSKFSRNKKVAALLVASILLLTSGSLGFNKYSEVQERNRIAAEAKVKADADAKAAKAKADADAAAYRAEVDAYTAAINDTSWVPSGFKKFRDNPYMAYKKNSTGCASYGACFSFDLITSKYCDSVYISANLEKDGVIYGYANDSANGISPGKRVKMKMQFTESVNNAYSMWVDVTCR